MGQPNDGNRGSGNGLPRDSSLERPRTVPASAQRGGQMTGWGNCEDCSLVSSPGGLRAINGQWAEATPVDAGLAWGWPGRMCLCSPAHLQALNGWEPFVGEQLAVALYVGLWESPRASLSQPLKSRDYLGPAGHPLKDIPPPAGVGAKGPPQRSCLPSPGPTSPSARKVPLSGETLRHPACCPQLPRLRTIPHARQGFWGTPHPPHPSRYPS